MSGKEVRLRQGWADISTISPYFNVRSYGASGNGTTDDTTAIAAAFTAAAISGGIVYFPAGTYLTSSAIIVPTRVSIMGEGPAASILWGNHSGITLSYTNIWTPGMFLRDLQIKGNNSSGSSYGNGTSTAIYFSSTAEETAHFSMLNVIVYGHGKGVSSTSTYGMFDCHLEKVDFIQCATWGYELSGSGNELSSCSFRLCNIGVEVSADSAGSIGGAVFVNPLCVANVVDFNINNATIRTLRLYGGWFEQTITTSFKNAVGGEVFFHSLVLDSCLFQPAATATNTGVFDIVSCKGSISFRNCVIFTDAYAGAFSQLNDNADCIFQLIGCYLVNAGVATHYTQIIGGVLNLPGGNILFPSTQVPSADVNTLDDYEEITSFSPTLTASITPPTGVTYNLQSGTAVKIGKQVSFSLTVWVNSVGASGAGDLIVGSLPYTADASGGPCTVVTQGVDWASATAPVGFIQGATTTLRLFEHADNAGGAYMLWGALATGDVIYASGTYFV